MPPLDPALLADPSPLTPGNAVAAILRLDDGRYLLQLRDSKPGIFFPGHWSLFGGAHEAGESDEEALLRELHEELGLTLTSGDLCFFTRIDISLGFCGLPDIKRSFFTATLPASSLDGLTVTEGQGLAAFDSHALLLEPHVVPYDAFALWLHVNQHRLTA